MNRLVKAIVTCIVADLAIKQVKKGIEAFKDYREVKKAEKELCQTLNDIEAVVRDATIKMQQKVIEELRKENEELKRKA